MNRSESINRTLVIALGIMFSLTASVAQAAGFNSGSTGVDGALNPSSNVTLTMPANGIFNYTTINIPVGVTVQFVRNAANTPVVFLATGDVTIAGTIDVRGGASQGTSYGTLGDRSLPGLGGPGGYDGGRAGAPNVNRRAGNGLGPGGGGGGDVVGACCSSTPQGGGGGGYSAVGNGNVFAQGNGNTGSGGSTYGSNLLIPLVGGSGGGGGGGAAAVDGTTGTGGGGGGGGILIASSGTVNLTGSILANGGTSGAITTASGGNLSNTGATGGGGSGGAIRIVASGFTGVGTLSVNGGGVGGQASSGNATGGAGGRGRTSIEIATTGTLVTTSLPTLAITSVAGIAAPALPTGTGDVSIPDNTPNPVTVAFATTGIPSGTTIKLTLTPQRGAATTVTSSALDASGTATASVNIPSGLSTLTASTSYTITVAMGEALSVYAQNERVEKINLSATLGGASKMTLVTVSGKEYDAPPAAMRFTMVGG